MLFDDRPSPELGTRMSWYRAELQGSVLPERLSLIDANKRGQNLDPAMAVERACPQAC